MDLSMDLEDVDLYYSNVKWRYKDIGTDHETHCGIVSSRLFEQYTEGIH